MLLGLAQLVGELLLQPFFLSEFLLKLFVEIVRGFDHLLHLLIILTHLLLHGISPIFARRTALDQIKVIIEDLAVPFLNLAKNEAQLVITSQQVLPSLRETDLKQTHLGLQDVGVLDVRGFVQFQLIC